MDVLLLDVASDTPDRNAVAGAALEGMRVRNPPPFMHPDHAARITTGNVEDHLDRASDCDWIVEAIVERIDVKRDLYRALERVRRPGSIVSSNTSTLPLSLLTDGMSDAMRSHFCITHFFNPVRFMRLLELVGGPDTRAEVIDGLARFCDVELGKGVVHCRDTPGFLANRIGVHALQAGLCEAVAQGVTVEQADAVMGRPMGIPKTALFGLYDLIGLDLMLDVAASLGMALPPDDAFQTVAAGIPVLHDLVGAGYTGNKGKGGFYRGDPDAREVVDLETGEFRPVVRAATEAAVAGERDGLRAMAEHPSAAGRFARRVLARVLGYAASLVPEVSDEIVPIDEAMKLGYGWTRGPFEMIDAMGVDWFRDLLAGEEVPVPPLIDSVRGTSFHRVRDGQVVHFVMGHGYRPLERGPGVVRLSDLSAPLSPILSNQAASLWDIGDGIACLEFHTKANALGPESMTTMRRALDRVAEAHRGLVILLRRSALLRRFRPRVRPRLHCREAVDRARRGARSLSGDLPGREARAVSRRVRGERHGARRRVRGAAGQRRRAGARERRPRARRAARRPGAGGRRLQGDAAALDRRGSGHVGARRRRRPRV